MRNTMLFMGATAIAAFFSYKPVLSAEAAAPIRQAALEAPAAAPAVAMADRPAAPKAARKTAMQPIAKRLVARVDLSSQTMQVEIDGEVSHSWKISSGATNGYHTPTGTYAPTHMTTLHRSRKYDNAPMPHAVFFRGGYAIHATGATWALGRPASHGCIRLSPANAKTFYSLVQKHGKAATQIRIAGIAPAKTSLRASPPSSSSASRRHSSESEYSWSDYGFNNKSRYVTSYSVGSRMKTQRNGKRIVHTWW